MKLAAQGKINDFLQNLENDLTIYWNKKRDYLEIDRLIEEYLRQGIDEIGVQVDGRGPQEFQDKECQFPEGDEETFEQFLERQLNEEREEWSKKEN